ncbi:MAG TPA: IS4 family transposase, partial [Mycobacterium sp.]|nr:IS4 family transposase [Mycobacterium sp.]
MPRAGWVKPESDQRLSDHISLGVLTRVFPPELIDEVLAECARVEVRHRLLPARVVVYYVLGLALFSTCSYEEVMRMLVAGHSWASGWSHEWSVPTKAALFQARKRLGSEPLRALFDKAVVPLADPQVAGGFYRSWRLMSIDGLCLDAADTDANVECFGRPASSRGEGRGGAFPQVRVLGLAECGSHAIIDAAVGAYRQGEQTLAESVLRSLLPGMLLLADRGFFSYALWSRARSTGADLL